MSFLRYFQFTITNAVFKVPDALIPQNVTHCEIQASSQNIRFIMDNISNPTQSFGMVLVNGNEPTLVLIEDLKIARFFRGAGSNAKLNCHFFAGRNV